MSKLWEARVEYGAMMGAPAYEGHKRGRNWMAIIEIDPSAPGGLHREFVKQAHGSTYYYMAPKSLMGKAVEFGADYFSGSGRRRRDREYGVVREITDDKIVIELFDTGRDAVIASKKPTPKRHSEASKRKYVDLYLARHAEATKSKPQVKKRSTQQKKTVPANVAKRNSIPAHAKKRRTTSAAITKSKATGKPTVVYSSSRQTGVVKNSKRDQQRKASPPGKRVSKTGRVYYEYRRNRTDKPGKRI